MDGNIIFSIDIKLFQPRKKSHTDFETSAPLITDNFSLIERC